MPARLGLPDFTFADLYQPASLARLHRRFLDDLAAADASLAQKYERYAAGAATLSAPDESKLLIDVAEHLSRFLGRLFGIEDELSALRSKLTDELALFEFKREFITRRVFRKGAPQRPSADEFPALDSQARLLLSLGFPGACDHDPERGLAQSVLTLLRLERLFSGQLKAPAEEGALRARWTTLRSALTATPDAKRAFGESLGAGSTDPAELGAVRALLFLLERWTYARSLHPEGRTQIRGFSTHQLPAPVDFQRLVECHAPDAARPEMLAGPPEHRRRRDGFKLTDRRMSTREVLDHVDYCVLCHERQKDSCARGLAAQSPEAGTFRTNPLGIPLTGCPLDERISEAHLLKGRGDSLGALAMIVLDNPMCPGTGHRICNDCMKACIYQKQEPVNIPQVETSIVTDVLQLPYGFELYALLTRWNPLNVKRPYALPYNGKNVLVVGLGPAGYTLAHFLLNEGFGVVGIDGLKIEPFADHLTGRNGAALEPLRDIKTVTGELDQRILAGFGGVSEYGITVRWDKNFLTILHLTLARRGQLRLYGGVRFGGTLTLDDAWKLGFDHVAVATGAGKPTVVGLKGNLMRGIRKASDFLMALQLTGAFKKDSLANLQVQLPAVVIGGGLTAIDTATELIAYYPLQVEKVLERYDALVAQEGERVVLDRMDPEEKETLGRFLAHGRAVRAERERVRASKEAPQLARLVEQWGGVSICYRRTLNESPAYRLNHEEIIKAFEEGICFHERMSPVEALADANGAVRAVKFERMKLEGGKVKGSGEFLELPARTVCVAAGTSPNTMYEREFPGTFALDEHGSFFRPYALKDDGGRFVLEPVEAHEDLGKPVGFFTSYQRDGRFVTFYGDNHPTYAGNVVKAMASARDGYPEVRRLFAKELAALDPSPAAQGKRDSKLAELFSLLDDKLLAQVVAVNRLTPTIIEVVARAPFAAEHFQPGQFYRLQTYETLSPVIEGTRVTTEGLALTGAWVDREKGLLSTIVLEMGSSSRQCATLKPGTPIVLMGPTGAPTEIPHGQTVLLAGGGLGNAVLFSIGQALRAAGSKVLYFAAYRQKTDTYKLDELERAADQVIWSVDTGELITPRRTQDATFRGNVVQAMVAYAKGELDVKRQVALSDVDRIIAIGSDRMMRAVKEARHTVLKDHLKPQHEAIGSINSPMQCMMKEICAQCLQKHVDPTTGKESIVFSCFNQDQHLDHVDFANLSARLRQNSVLEKMSNLWLDHLRASAARAERG